MSQVSGIQPSPPPNIHHRTDDETTHIFSTSCLLYATAVSHFAPLKVQNKWPYQIRSPNKAIDANTRKQTARTASNTRQPVHFNEMLLRLATRRRRKDERLNMRKLMIKRYILHHFVVVHYCKPNRWLTHCNTVAWMKKAPSPVTVGFLYAMFMRYL